MDATSIRAAFRKAFNGHPNILTPDRVSVGQSGPYLYEISKGRALFGDGDMFGVTVLNAATGEPEHDLSKAADTLADAKAYALSLKARA